MNVYYLMAFAEHTPLGPLPLDAQAHHLTILQAFHLPPHSEAVLLWLLTEDLRGSGSFTLRKTGELKLGDDGSIPAIAVESPERNLRELHELALTALKAAGGRLLKSEFGGAGYTPHISFADQAPQETFSTLTLVCHGEAFGRDVRALGHIGLD